MVTDFDINPALNARTLPRLQTSGYNPNPYGSSGAVANRIRSLVSGFNLPAYNPAGDGYVPSMNNNGAGRPVGSLVPQVRSPNVQSALTPAFQTRTANSARSTQSLSDWTKEFLKNRPRAQRFADEEMSSIGRLYGSGSGSLEGELSGIRNDRSAAIRDMTEAAMRRAGRADSLRRMTGGNSSYLDRVYGQSMRDIAASTAASGADQHREDALYLDQSRRGAAGSRTALLDQLLGRELYPAQVGNAVEGSDLDRLSQLSGIEYGNNDYLPAEDAYGRRLDFLQRLQGLGY